MDKQYKVTIVLSDLENQQSPEAFTGWLKDYLEKHSLITLENLDVVSVRSIEVVQILEVES